MFFPPLIGNHCSQMSVVFALIIFVRGIVDRHLKPEAMKKRNAGAGIDDSQQGACKRKIRICLKSRVLIPVLQGPPTAEGWCSIAASTPALFNVGAGASLF